MTIQRARAALLRCLTWEAERDYHQGLITAAECHERIDAASRVQVAWPSALPATPGGPMLYTVLDEHDEQAPEGVEPAQVRAMRLHHGHTRHEAADALGVHVEAWAAWETGEAMMPPVLADRYILGEVFKAMGEPWPGV